MAKLQSDRYERGYLHKIWMESYCTGKNCRSGTLSVKFIRCQNPYVAVKYQNFVNISEAQKPTWTKFLEFQFFLSENIRLYI